MSADIIQINGNSDLRRLNLGLLRENLIELV